MPIPTNLTVFGVDNGHIELYNLSEEQFELLRGKDDWDTIEKFKLRIDAADDGYVPDALVEIANLAGWHVATN